MQSRKTYSIEEAVKAQRSLRKAAGLGEEQFPVEAFVGMVSDEIEALRKQGKSDDEIASIIRSGSNIDVTPEEIASNYASSQERHQTRR